MQKHSHPTPEGRAFWYTERLWQLAEGLPVFTIAIDAIPEFDQNCWFRDPPTCREVAEHARQIMDADLDFPVIFSADGRLMDGGHRIAKAWLLGHTEIKVQRFDRTPEPEYILAED
jgi:hypothetical protein